MSKRYFSGLISAAVALSVPFLFGIGTSHAAYVPPLKIPTCNTGVASPCTDFFGVPNSSNSPLPAGSVTAITVVDAGGGYSSAPAVTITDSIGSGSGATASATVAGGVVTGITVINQGSGYVAPQVAIDPPPSGDVATASATVGGALTGGMRKFVDTLPGIGSGARAPGTALGANNLGQYLPLATPDKTTFPGSDYYVIGLKDYNEQMHSDLPLAGTKIRGYYQVNGTDHSNHYLGPMILATKNRPVRVLFQNELPTGNLGDLFIPTDTTYMGAGLGPDGVNYYTQNRATLHLHGGTTPWISDGTPHQWITPPNETGTIYQKGNSFQNVPDMVGAGKPIPSPSANDGLATFFWSNQQGGRLMFYHDHAYGLTRLNVYAGEAAGYLLVDPAEETALAAATVPGTVITDTNTGSILSHDLGHLIPLVIQDKTFVPPTNQLTATDPTWDTTHYGSTGNLWFPHVYMTNQDPSDSLNMNAFGRWDYGPWFFPPQTSLTAGPLTIPCTSSAYPGRTVQCPIIPNPSGTPEAFMDTPVVNGTPYPVLHVAPAAYRFRILSAGNDRTWNLSWFEADVTGKEVPLVPAVTPLPGSSTPVCSIQTRITNPGINGLAIGALDASGMPLNGTGLPANCWPSTWPLTAGTGGTVGLTGVVPNPLNAGPAWVMIGTEGGLLPAPVVIPPTPALFETNPKSVTVGSVASHGLLLGPAERADVIVDFSPFAGKTLILYNDGPAPIPGYDVRNDYYAGDIDNSSTGGAPPTQPGYGPNTRTIMQVIVDATNPNTSTFSLNALKQAMAATASSAGLFQSTQPNIIVPESTYNTAYNRTYNDTFMKLQDDYLSYINFDGTIPAITLTAAGSGYATAPAVTFTGGGCTTAPTATATVSGGEVAAIALTSAGIGCTSVPTVTIGGPGTGATAIVGAYIKRKTIQELFTADYGRLNATLGTELPLTNFLTQTTIPLGYIDPPTEIFRDGETQFWRVTHNGVDTHLIHFHLFNVQLINRVGWDGTIRLPDINEIGWKDTVRMNPLEDVIVALQPVKMSLPFPIPDSVRNLDVAQPEGTSSQFTGVDPFTNEPMPTVNQPVNFGWEYVWHCHILGHEENDMMRPMIFQVPPETPTTLTAASQLSPAGVNLSWTNNSISATSFTIQRATDSNFTQNLQTFVLGTATMSATPLARGSQSYLDTTAVPGTAYYYRVAATKTFPARQSPTWGVGTVVTDNLNSPFVSVATAGNITVTPASGAFGNVGVNFTSYPPITFNVSNNSAITLTRNSISLSGTDAAMFSINTGTCGPTLAAGATCNFTASFLPTSVGAKSASISVNYTGATVSIPLSGTGIAATNAVQRISPLPITPYTTMTSAFTAATGATTLQAWGVLFTEPSVVVSSSGTVTFGGGYDSTYTAITGITSLQGALTVRNGALIVGNLAIM